MSKFSERYNIAFFNELSELEKYDILLDYIFYLKENDIKIQESENYNVIMSYIEDKTPNMTIDVIMFVLNYSRYTESLFWNFLTPYQRKYKIANFLEKEN